MGGIDLLDQLISYYRVFIKSKKWTLRVIFHFMDFAVAASWLEYRADCDRCEIPRNQQHDLCYFRLEIIDCLLSETMSVKQPRGRPSLELITSIKSSSKRKRESKPPIYICHDNYGHLPRSDEKAFSSRCKNFNCLSKTQFFCTKCNVHLCISKGKNCFEEFHRK
jgi:hypothetical protein